MTTSNTADSTDKTFTVVIPKKPKSDLSNIDQTRRAVQDIREDLEEHQRIHKQLLKIDGIDVILYKEAEKIAELDTLHSILKLHLHKMGGR